MRILIVQTALQRALLAADPDAGRRYVLRMARERAGATLAAIIDYETKPHALPDTVAIRARVGVSTGGAFNE
jgi:hypothetical protein